MGDDALLHASGERRGSRIRRPGSRAIYAAATVVALLIAVVIVLVVSGAGSGDGGIAVAGRHLPTTAKYGHTPKWLKIPEPSAATTPVATPSRPQLRAMQGYPVRATLSSGASVLYSVVGPTVPDWVAKQAGTGAWKQGETAPATFAVTFRNVTGTVPISASDFAVITYTGKLLYPKVTTAGGGPLPTSVAAGHSLKLTLKTSLPEGDGEIRWAPDGRRILVSYVWTLEFD